METIGERFKRLRLNLGLNQAELAKRIQANPSLISDIERGEREPSKNIIVSLVEIFNLNANWLLTCVGEPFIKESTTPPKPTILEELEKIAAEAPQFKEMQNRQAALEKEIQEIKKLLSDIVGEKF
ncbi:helix-turn-helix domain-containing protein [Treponema phagedenis]|uniref:helix-turn-helix domain-containing protein n=1 Tax=Treponema phagedenis TaxID=162 RepID=UPI0001F63E83|nr:helix-turn-helix transcriptional regulator [Treponema phagedenis]EFW37909.1 DNA-binding helix-turn-helix protein [Treponema phagedenis F0421]QSH99165.1 helix-turn-helix domain-containing protein [Treponema phagedenis]